MKRHKDTKRIIGLTLLTIAILFAPQFTFAQETEAGGGFFSQLLGGLFSLAGVALSPVLLMVGFIGYLFANLTGLLFALFGLLGGFAVNIQAHIVSPNNTIVQTGWTVVRDVANLGFVLAIIIIAFTTILRLEQYQTQKFLPKLIAAAILVNFSLAIGAVFIDFSQILTTYFFNRAGGDNPFILFLGSLDPQRLLSAFNFSSFSQGVTQFGSAAINFALAPWFIALFNLTAAFVVLVAAVMLVVRFFYLSFLLIISPIVWLFWVIPGLTDNFSKWWDKFLKWVFFAPAFSFFFYLAIYSSLNAGSLFALGRTSEGTAFGLGLEANFASIFLNGIRMLLPIGMLIAGLVVAETLGIAGAKGALGVAKKAGTGIRKGVGGYLKQTAPEKLTHFGENWPKGTRWLGGGARLVGKGLQGLQKGAGGVRETLGLIPPSGLTEEERKRWKPNTFLGHLYQSTKGEFKKKKRKLTPEEIAAGTITEEGGEEGGGTRPAGSPLTENLEEEFRQARGEGPQT